MKNLNQKRKKKKKYGGSWKEVKAIIVEELSFDFDVTVVMYNKEKTEK